MIKKLSTVIFISCLFLISLFRINFICAQDLNSTGSGNILISDYTIPEISHEEYVEKFLQEEELFIEPIIGEVETLPYTEEELELLAHLIFAEAGSDWCSDKMQQYTGSVVLNRVTSSYFPNTLKDVIYQPGQYSVVKSGAINKTPNQRAYDVAKFLLENGSVLPSHVIFQSQHTQGDGIYEKVQNMYFCYKN